MINTNNAVVAYSSYDYADNTAFPIVAENGHRVGLIIYNASNKDVFIHLAWDNATSTTETYSFVIPASGRYDMPLGYTTVNFYARWDEAATGSLKVTEVSDY